MLAHFCLYYKKDETLEGGNLMHLFQKTPPKDTIDEELLEEINRVKRQMENAHSNFQNALDPDLIDCYIFESNAAWKKYRFLLRQAKMH